MALLTREEFHKRLGQLVLASFSISSAEMSEAEKKNRGSESVWCGCRIDERETG